MNSELSPEAAQIGAVVRKRIEGAGGVQVLRDCVEDPDARAAAGALLEPIGVWELDPHEDQLQFEAAAAAAQAAGSFGFPYPVVERLGRAGAEATLLVAEHGPRTGMHLDLPLKWNALDLRGRAYRLTGRAGQRLGVELAPFGIEFDAEPEPAVQARSAAVLITLHAWWLLGLLERAATDSVRYATEREQFGRPIAQFQAVSFRLADMTLAVRSFEALAKYTVWSIANGVDDHAALVDALALRLASLDAAEQVMRGAHQVHGAMGFTDEVDVSWLSRVSQSVRRLPEGRHRTASTLVAVMGAQGLGDLGLLSVSRPVTTL